MVGIDKTKHGIETMAHLVVNVIQLSKDGLNFSSTRKLVSILAEIRSLAKELVPIMEEVKDLDTEESEALVKFTFQLIQQILAEIAEG